ncbi:hypothetical protein L226DRAFT_344138 [Lentinus tigrinus ALCF2SS1-7]|uniref:uncharacterized protein n=1 Tax=Lentinus tigrinus ALCF2SS1-7 TaxID=1328758 RepID=UPI0011660FA4|nr:hypothetical protein L226DRAFT_344138 [Lentinus tigrinus ALCF2SS1-7]
MHVHSKSSVHYPLPSIYPHSISSPRYRSRLLSLVLPRFGRLCSPKNIAVLQRHVYIIMLLPACDPIRIPNTGYTASEGSPPPIRIRVHLAKAKSTSTVLACSQSSYYSLVLFIGCHAVYVFPTFRLSYVCHPPSSRTLHTTYYRTLRTRRGTHSLQPAAQYPLPVPAWPSRSAHDGLRLAQDRASPTPPFASSPTAAPGSICPSLPRSTTPEPSVPSIAPRRP